MSHVSEVVKLAGACSCGFAAMPALIQVGRMITQSSRNSGLDDALNDSADGMAELIRKFVQA